MRVVRRSIALTGLALLITLCAASAASATNVSAGATFQNGNCLDTAQSNCGGWDQTAPTALNRPFIKSLIVTPAGGSAVTVINNVSSPVQSPDVTSTSHSIYAVVAPTNACNTSQTPGVSPGCYATPNRVTVSLIREVSAGNWSYDFTSAAGSPAVTTGATIDMTIGIKSAYSALRWSWVNGQPSFWTTTVTPGLGGDVHIKFAPRTMPDSNGMPNSCTTIPVSSCGDATTQPVGEVLTPQIILSMDTTLDAAFTGVLFGSSSAFIGSLESSPITAGQAPTLTYGVAAPHLVAASSGGGERTGTFYALVPNSILTLFGTAAATFDSTLLPITRTGDSGSYTPSWTEWTAGTNGTAGQLLTISNISFSSPKFVVGRQSSSGGDGSGGGGGNGGNGSSNTGSGSGGNENRVKLGSTTKIATLIKALNLKTSGSKTSVTTSTPKVCTATKGGIKAIAVGTCKATVTVTPKKGKPTKKSITLVVTKTGKRLPISLHR